MALDSQPTWQDLLDLVASLSERDYDSVAVTFGTISVRMSRGASVSDAPVTPGASPASEVAPAPTDSAAPDGSHGSSETKGPAITAPMLGIFYRRPAPGADPFVEPGQSVEPDTVIGIIEIMKLMNPVSAGQAGVLASFAVEDGSSVEFGQALAHLEPTSS